MDAKVRLTIQEIHALVQSESGQNCPAICSPEQLAEFLGVPVSTVYQWKARKRFEGAYVRRGKHLRFLRDPALLSFCNGAEWK